MELAFKITQIYFKLAEDTTDNIKYFDYITFKISSFGTFVQMKTYDRNVQVYLNYIEVVFNYNKNHTKIIMILFFFKLLNFGDKRNYFFLF